MAEQKRPYGLAPWIVLGAFLVLTAIATKYVWENSQIAERARFQRSVQTAEEAVQSRVDTYVNVLQAASGLFAAAQDVTRDQFRAYVRSLELQRRHPGIQGIGISVRVPQGRMEDVVADMRLNEFPDFRVWPETPARDEYHTIVLLEPMDDRNRAAIGFDMFTDMTRRQAMIRARDSGEPAASGRVTLVQEIDAAKQPGFLIYVPVYTTPTIPPTVAERRQALYGFVYSPFRINDLFAGIFGNRRSEVDYEVFEDGQLLYRTGSGENRPARYTAEERLIVAGRDWRVRFTSQRPARVLSRRFALLTLVSGLVISFLLFTLVLTLQRARAQAERTTAELQNASRAKDEFLATLSHELRTPMTAILGWSKLLGEDLDDESRSAAIDAIQKSSAAQAQLIEDLLDVSRITANKMVIDHQPTELAAVVKAAVAAVAPAATPKGIDVSVETPEDPIMVSGDHARLQQIVWNLVSNAVKFTPRGGKVNVTASRQDGEAVISVRDTGQGIEPDFLPYVFDRFRQADSSTTRAYTGLGLGLAIVRHLVEMHQGTVKAMSEGPGKGSTFMVRMPLLAAGTLREEKHVDAAAAGELRGARLLVVDDEDDVRDYAAAVFRTSGAEIRCAESADEAMGILDSWKPDVIVTDIGMPEKDGYEFLRTIRADSRLHAIPVIALTAYARPEDMARAQEAGFEAFVAKPVTPADLRAEVGEVLARTTAN